MKKRGISHVEVILAFVIFIVAVGFGLFFFNAGGGGRIVDATITYLFTEIDKNTTVSVEVFSVNVTEEVVGIPFGDVLVLNFSGIQGETRVENYEGENLSSSRGGVDDELVYVHSDSWAGGEFLFVSFGDEFLDDRVTGSPENHNESYYILGSSESQNLISEKRFILLNQTYSADYDGLKSQDNFNIPDRADFGFSLVFGEGDEIVAKKEVPDGFEVYGERKRVRVLRVDGSKAYADLLVKVW